MCPGVRNLRGSAKGRIDATSLCDEARPGGVRFTSASFGRFGGGGFSGCVATEIDSAFNLFLGVTSG